MMNNQSSRLTEVDVGTPPSGFRPWELANVNFHGFTDLPTLSRVDSPKFECLGRRWRLEVYPGGDDTARDGSVTVYLRNMSEKRIEIYYFWTARGPKGKEVVDIHEPLTNDFAAHGDKDNHDVWGQDVERSRILDALVEGTLTIVVKMRRVSAPANSSCVSFVPENPLCKNILKKFMDEESADIVFEVGDATASTNTAFRAHFFILQDGAPVLAELCRPGDEEGLISVSIADVKPEMFRLVLYYVYGGEVSSIELDENAKEIIDAADKFGVVNLKLEAEACYVKSTTFTIDNILDNLLYAESKNCALLKEAVMDFIVENGEDFIDKVSFANVPNVPSSIVMDLLTAMMRGKKVGGSSDTTNYKNMRVGTLRKILHEKGLDVDGSREAMISLLNENS